MNILIVDDNANNRMILRLLLEDYSEDNGVVFHLEEAEDGQIALEKSAKSDYDIIFMDIMMPNMDGIEATRLIRQANKKVMIIAVSAVDDTERKKHILRNGAEDYISKPVNSDIFISRIANYITLVQARKHTRINEAGINLYTKEIFNRHIRFFVKNEDALSEFWEYFLLESTKNSDELSDVVRTLFTLGEYLVRLGIEGEIYYEESESFLYFTLLHIDKLPPKAVELLLRKNSITSGYKLVADRLSFELVKVPHAIIEPLQNSFVTPEKVPQSYEQSSAETLVVAPSMNYASGELKVYHYMDVEDQYDLEEFVGKLNTLMLMVGSGEITSDDVADICAYLEKISSILVTYSEVYSIASALSDLANDMADHTEIFSANSEALAPMCRAFSNDMNKWIEMTFHTGAPSVDFMNDTIVVNAQTIASMLRQDSSSSGDDASLDDIFDF